MLFLRPEADLETFSPNTAWTPVSSSCVEEKVGRIFTPALHAATGGSTSKSAFTLPSSFHLVSLCASVFCYQCAATIRGNKENQGTFSLHLKHDKLSPVSKCYIPVYIKLLLLCCLSKPAAAESSVSARGFLEIVFRKIYSRTTLF